MALGTLALRRRRRGRQRYVNAAGDAVEQDVLDILDWRDRVVEVYQRLHDQWFLNIERWDGTLGQHYWRPEEVGDVPGPSTQTPPWRCEYMAPYIMSTIEQHASMVATVPTRYFCEPVSDDPDDRNGAEAGTRVANYLRSTLHLDKLRRETVRLLDMLGIVLGKVGAEPVAGPDGEVHGFRSTIGLVPPWEICLDPWAESIHDSSTIIHEYPEHIEALRLRWKGVKRAEAALRDLDPDAYRIPDNVRQRIERVQGLLNGIALSDDDVEGIVVVREVDRHPRLGAMRGEYRVIVNDTEIYKGDLPYIDAGIVYPFHELRLFHKPGVWAGLGLADVMWSAVKIIEDLVNQGVENIALSTWGKWFVDDRIDIENRFTTEPGEVIPFDAMQIGKPAYFETPQAWSLSAFQLLQWLVQQLFELTGVRDPSRSGVPKRIESGVALAIAQEADKTRAGMVHLDVDEWFRGLMRDAIAIEQRYGGAERHAQMIGKGRHAQVAAFGRADLSANLDLHVRSSPTLSDNRALREAQILQRVQLGVMDIEEARDALDEPTSDDDIVSARASNRLLAEENFERIARGEQVELEEAWDHGVMWRQFKWLMSTHMFLDLDPERKAAVREHWKQLEGFMLARTVGMNAMLGGGGAGSHQGRLGPGSAETQQEGLTSSERRGTLGPNGGFDGSGSPSSGSNSPGGGVFFGTPGGGPSGLPA